MSESSSRDHVRSSRGRHGHRHGKRRARVPACPAWYDLSGQQMMPRTPRMTQEEEWKIADSDLRSAAGVRCDSMGLVPRATRSW